MACSIIENIIIYHGKNVGRHVHKAILIITDAYYNIIIVHVCGVYNIVINFYYYVHQTQSPESHNSFFFFLLNSDLKGIILLQVELTEYIVS